MKRKREKLRSIRKSKGVSQTFLSELLGYEYPSGYSNIENGTTSLTLEKAKIIADVLGVSIEDLLEDNENFFDTELHKKAKTTA